MSDGRLPSGENTYDWLVEKCDGRRGPLLDVACGDGFLLDQLASTHQAQTLFGIDMSAGEIALAKKRPALMRDQVQVANARRIPFASEMFETVVSHMALMLMPKAGEVFREIRRVMKDGGRLVFVVGRLSLIESAYTDLYLAEVARALKESSLTTVAGLTDERMLTTSGLKSLMTESGFREPVIQESALKFEYAPEAMADHFLMYYPSQPLSPEAKATLRTRLIEAFQALPASTVPHGEGVLLVQV